MTTFSQNFAAALAAVALVAVTWVPVITVPPVHANSHDSAIVMMTHLA